MSKQTTHKTIYDVIGYTFLENAPKIVTGLILFDRDTGGEFKASVLESKFLNSKGQLNFPGIDDVDEL